MTYYPTKGEDAVSAIGKEQYGLTKREYFAAMAMQGILANGWQEYKKDEPECYSLADTAINFADALIEQLNKT